MLVAQKKRKENVAEYILYMFQIEDIIRALDFDAEALHNYVQNGYRLTPEQMAETEKWYEEIAMEMQLRDAVESGHIARVDDLISELQTLCEKLLKDPTQSLFASLYYAALPSVVQIRSHSGGHNYKEVEAAFVGIYGYLTLKNKGAEISEETEKAVKQFSTFLAMLADRYRGIEEGTFTLTEKNA